MSEVMHPLGDTWRDLERRFDAACAQTRARVIGEFNQLLRRFRQYGSEGDWVRLVLEGTAPFARRVALFSLENGRARLRGQRNLDLAESFSFLCAGAMAFEAARTSADAVITLRTPAEVTETLSDSDPESRVHLFPISNASRVAAILFVVIDAETDAQAMELVAGLASCALERQANAAPHPQIAAAPASISVSGRARLPEWANLEEPERQIHLRARRFARVAVAEIELAKPEACRVAREQGDLYLFLKSEIEKAREIYGRQFRTISSMADYLHQELVRTAAGGDEMKLGAEYPGPLV